MSSNIVLIVLDTARQTTVQRLLENGDLPALERIAEEGIQFTSAAANGAWTLPTHASLFTGKRISRHGAHAGSKYFDPTGWTLAERLSSVGYRTLGISGNVWVSPEFGFDRGFDNLSMKWDRFWTSADLSSVSSATDTRTKVEELLNQMTVTNTPATLLNSLYATLFSNRKDDGAENSTRRAMKWFRSKGRDNQPFFFFLNYMEAHLEYDPVPKYRERFATGVDEERIEAINQDPWEYILGKSHLSDEDFRILESLYEAEIAYLDERIGQLYDTLEQLDLLDETAIIIVGDHGENIDDHGMMDHQYCLYETLMNVPLLVRPPGGGEGKTVEGIVETRDVYPTILDLAGIRESDDTEVSNNSLLASPEREYVIGEYRAPQPSMDALESQYGNLPRSMREYDRALRSVRVGDWKLIEGSDETVELYDLGEDCGETVDLSTEHPDTVAELSDILDSEDIPISPASQGRVEMSTSSRSRLEDLGYL
ncbi:sulfatase [Salinirubellus sp. GCM10025818]|uniref:sulfatase family protein n=1 Tax=Salinirubellus TaxID=2162630 RepID=UPI0030D1F9F4